jgi:hypothetical protein
VLGCTCCCIQVVLSRALLWSVLLLLWAVPSCGCCCCCIRARGSIQLLLVLLLLLLLLQGGRLLLQLLLLDAPQLLQDLDLRIQRLDLLICVQEIPTKGQIEAAAGEEPTSRPSRQGGHVGGVQTTHTPAAALTPRATHTCAGFPAGRQQGSCCYGG